MTELTNIIDHIVPEDEPKFFNTEEEIELHETCLHMMEEFVNEHTKLITEPDFEEIFDENIHELMHAHFDYDIFYTDEAEEEMEEIIQHAKHDFYNIIIPPRSYSSSIILKDPDINKITKQINILREKPQPNQRTKEWYELRQNLITASNAWKAFENDNTKNQLIYEKCKPSAYYIEDDCDEDIKKVPVQLVNTNTTLHWGQKYEPLSDKFYEFTYNTKIEDFGCIQHDAYMFLGASPDGINIDPTSPRYGRMLEIKNIVNREIDGIPKKEYWIQMQLQMEVCNLDECDFLETKFIEYPDRLSYEEDTLENQHNITISKDNKTKGIIIHFHNKDGSPFYLYKPLHLTNTNDIKQWQEDSIDTYQSPPYNHTFVQFIYWKLEIVSCVLVLRNKKWFKDNIKDLQDIWDTIEKERVSGYDHRAPNRKVKKENITNYFPTGTTSSGCLLKFNKDTSINVIKTHTLSDTSIIKLDIQFNQDYTQN